MVNKDIQYGQRAVFESLRALFSYKIVYATHKIWLEEARIPRLK